MTAMPTPCSVDLLSAASLRSLPTRATGSAALSEPYTYEPGRIGDATTHWGVGVSGGVAGAILKPHTEEWVRDWLIPELTRLASFGDNWDGYDAAAPSMRALEKAGHFLRSLGDLQGMLHKPSLMGSPEGGVIVEWETDDVELSLLFEAQGSVIAQVLTPRGEVEDLVKHCRDEVLDALTLLLDSA